jgi:nucleotide-binding universal stress UspA family protein
MERTVLVPLDGSPLSERALPIALDIARRGGGRVHVVRAHNPLVIVAATGEAVVTPDLLEADKALRAQSNAALAATASKSAAEGGVRVDARLEDGSPASVICRLIEELNADLTVMTTHGAGGFAPGWLGSVTDSVIRHSHRPVLVLPENEAEGGTPFVPRRILVPLDGSALSAAILPAARDLALLYGAQIDLVRVVAPYIPGDVLSTLTKDQPDPYGIDEAAAGAKLALDRVKADLEKLGLTAHATVRIHTWPTKLLAQHVKETEPDCIALATQGRGVSRLFIGSVADKLLRSMGLPVLVLRPPKHEAPTARPRAAELEYATKH